MNPARLGEEGRTGRGAGRRRKAVRVVQGGGVVECAVRG